MREFYPVIVQILYLISGVAPEQFLTLFCWEEGFFNEKVFLHAMLDCPKV
jgi:hypothetical protein